eukprot:8107145-Pyramimonas_sp.AAC.1
MADRELDGWKEVWTVHEQGALEKPPDFEDWAELPRMSIGHLRRAALCFKGRTAVGQSGIAPRALWHL